MSYIDDKFYVLEHIDKRTLLEQLADVLVTADAVGIPILESCDNSKWRRWAARIKKECEKKDHKSK